MVNEGIKSLKSEMDRLGLSTYGQYLRWREKRNLPTRIKPRPKVNGKGDEYRFYPSRAMLMDEFDAIWACQREATPNAFHLTEALRSQLHNEMFFQRDVTFPPPGRCPYHPDEPRLARASRLFHERRIYEEANHLRFHDRCGNPLVYTVAMRDRIVEVLMRGDPLTPSNIKALLEMPNTTIVNYEAGQIPKKIKGNPIDRAFEDAGVGGVWAALNGADQDAVLDAMVEAPNVQRLRERLGPYFPNTDTIESLLSVSLPGGHGRMGATATRAILTELKREVVPARVAEDKAGLSHAMTADGKIHERLPYYGELLNAHTVKPMWESSYRRETDAPPNTNRDEGRYGRIPNPVVHVAMNQLRRVVNEIISSYGLPLAIHVELARDLQRSQDERNEILNRNKRREKQNNKIREELTKLGVAISRPNIQRYRLWQEQGAQCIYTGECIGKTRLFSDYTDVDHLIPRSLVGNGVTIKAIDSLNNRVVCLRQANAKKGDKTPHEAFSGSPDGYEWSAIMRRAKGLSGSKRRRFLADARDRFTEDDDFRARDGTDNAYIARITRQYLSCLYGDQDHVIAVSSHITSLLRGKWGLNSVLGSGETGTKSRDDHRHHYVDALVAACSSRRVIQSIHTESKRCWREGREEFVKDVEPPFGKKKAFRAAVKRSLDGVLVARKPDHAVQGQMHEDTLHGIMSGPDSRGYYIAVLHKDVREYRTFAALGRAKIQATLRDYEFYEEARQRIELVRASILAYREQAERELLAEAKQAEEEGGKFRDPSENAIYQRALKLQPKDAPKTFDLFGRKRLVNFQMSGNQLTGGYESGRNHRVEFYADAEGRVRMEVISMLEANNPAFIPQSGHSGHQLIWKAHKDDLLLMDDPDVPNCRSTFSVVKIRPGDSVGTGKMGVVPVFDARASDGNNKRRLIERGCGFFCQQGAQRIITTPIGVPSFHFPALPKSGRVSTLQ